MAKTPAWQRAEGKNPKGGLNEKGRASLRAEGHDIKRPQPEGGSRRDSFCARMKGMKAKLTSKETANDPDSRINKSLRAWNCADGGAVDPYADVQRAAKADGGVEFGDPGGRTRLSALERLKLAGQEYFGPKQEWQQLRDQVKASGMLTPNPHGQPYTEAVSNVKTMFGYPAIGQPFSYHRLNDLPMGQGVWSQTSPTQREYISPRSEAMPDKFPISKEDAAQIDQFTRHNMEGATSWRQAGEPSVMPTTPRQPMNVPMGGVTPAASTRFMETPIKTQAAIQSPTTQANINALVRPLYGDSGFTGRPVFETGVNRDVVASDPILPAAHTPSQAQIPWEQTHYDYSHKVDPSHFPTLPLREMTSSGSTSMLGHIYGTGQIDPKISDPNVERHEMQDIMNQMQGKQAMPDLPSEPIENAAPESSAPDPYEEVNRAAGGPIWNKPRPKKLGKPEHLSSKEKASAKAAAKAAGRPYPNLIDNMRAARADGGPADDRAHEFVKEQLQSGEPQVPQYVAENDFPARAARGVEAVDTAASRVNNMLANVVGQSAMRSPEGRTASEIVQSAMPVDPYQAVQQAARQWHEGDRLGAAETMAAGMPMQGAIRAYHGSPYKFDQFDISKIGTGAGAQAYGHGLYFAEAEPVAKTYAENAADKYSPESIASRMLRNQDRDQAIQRQAEHIARLEGSHSEDFIAPYRGALDILKSGQDPKIGHMYEVDIHAKPEQFLNWEKEYTKQSPLIKEALKSSGIMKDYRSNLSDFTSPMSTRNKMARGENIYEYLSHKLGGYKNAAEALKELGIEGTRYLDAGSREARRDFHNLAVFDPNRVEILRRYADGGEVEGDVQFAPDDPYAKVQEAAKLPMMAQNDFAMRMPQPEVRYDTGPQPGEATMKSYDPTVKERIYQGIAGTEERPSPERAQFARGISQMAEFAPVLGNLMAGQEAQRRGDTKGMLMAALPVPGMATEARMAEAAMSPAEQAAKEAYQRVLNAQGLYSHAAETASNLPQAKGSYEQMMAMLQKAGVKPEEMRWSGVEQFAGQPVTREQLATHFQENLPKIEETVLGEIPADKMKAIRQEYAAAEYADTYENLPSENKRRIDDLIRQHRSGPSYQQYTIPGGENYREVLMHMPPKSQMSDEDILNYMKENFPNTRSSDEELINRFNNLNKYQDKRGTYQSSHWDQPNVLGHLRLSDRTGPQGEKILHMEELQSDWGQAGRKKGFAQKITPEMQEKVNSIASKLDPKFVPPHARTSNGTGIDTENFLIRDINHWRDTGAITPDDANVLTQYANAKSGTGIPSAPYVENTQNWVDLGLKRALREAAENGYDKLVWTPGAEQAARYDLSKQVGKLSWSPDTDELIIHAPNGAFMQKMIAPKNELESLIGKEAAEKLINSNEYSHAGNVRFNTLEGEGLKIGGKGMEGFYDKILPAQLQKIVKKLDPQAKVELGGHEIDMPDRGVTGYSIMSELPETRNMTEEEQNIWWRNLDPERRQNLYQEFMKVEPVKAHSITITPKMREAILKGLPAYAKGGEVVNDTDPYDNMRSLSRNFPRARRVSH